MMAPNLPQIRVADVDLLSEWDLSENVRALGDSIPGYRSGASKYKYRHPSILTAYTSQSLLPPRY